MIPVGYMAKNVAARPDWLKASLVNDIYSVSSCISDNFTDYINYWKHNGYWLFDTPITIWDIAKQNSLDISNAMLFFYEVYELEFDADKNSWIPFDPESSFVTEVTKPGEKTLEGYDVVTFSGHTSPECSPLSCNALATELETNEHCLLPSLEKAKEFLDAGKFKNSEPGPYRIFAVYTVQWS